MLLAGILAKAFGIFLFLILAKAFGFFPFLSFEGWEFLRIGAIELLMGGWRKESRKPILLRVVSVMN